MIAIWINEDYFGDRDRLRRCAESGGAANVCGYRPVAGRWLGIRSTGAAASTHRSHGPPRGFGQRLHPRHEYVGTRRRGVEHAGYRWMDPPARFRPLGSTWSVSASLWEHGRYGHPELCGALRNELGLVLCMPERCWNIRNNPQS